MNIAIRNLHKLSIHPNSFHGYIKELIKTGYVSHLFFENVSFADDTFRIIRKSYSWKELGLDKVKIIFSADNLEKECDVLINFESRESDFTEAVKNFSGLKIFHIMDYFWGEPLSDKVKRLKEYGIDYVFSYGSPDKYCDYFKKHAPDFIGRVIPLPFGYHPRFISTKPILERKKKSVGIGSVRPLRFPNEPEKKYIEVANFLKNEFWFHKFRRMLVKNKGNLSDIMDSMLPVFPRYRDYDYDMVTKFNEYQLFVSDESIFYFPSAKTFEGPATGAVMVCSTHSCFTDYGFIDGVNCIKHKEFDIEDFKNKTQAIIDDKKRLKSISEAGKKMVETFYSHKVISEKMFLIINYLFKKENPADLNTLAYDLYCGAPSKTQELLLKNKNTTNLKTRLLNYLFYTYIGFAYYVAMEIKDKTKKIFMRLNKKSLTIIKKLARQRLQNFGVQEAFLRKKYHWKHPQTPLPPPTEEEDKLISELKKKIKLLKEEDLKKITEKINEIASPERKWTKFKNELREKILSEDPRDFLNWEVIRYNMLYGANTKDLAQLKNSANWPSLYKAMTEPKSTNRNPFFLLPEVNENTIRQAFHLTQFSLTSGINIKDFEIIVDFGGGYGNMCRLVHALGFKGKYIILDWPEFSCLQKFYLKLSGVSVPILNFEKNQRLENGVTLVNKIEDLEYLLAKLDKDQQSKKLLVATWSMSEVSVDFRDKIFSTINPDACLITYQKAFGGVNNIEYFSGFIEKKNNIEWFNYPMSYIPTENNHYLIGIKKKNV